MTSLSVRASPSVFKNSHLRFSTDPRTFRCVAKTSNLSFVTRGFCSAKPTNQLAACNRLTRKRNCLFLAHKWNYAVRLKNDGNVNFRRQMGVPEYFWESVYRYVLYLQATSSAHKTRNVPSELVAKPLWIRA